MNCLLLDLRAGLISQAKGSAFAEFDKTKVVCAVYVLLLILSDTVNRLMSITVLAQTQFVFCSGCLTKVSLF